MENQFNHPESEKRISTAVGAVILVLISIIIVLVVWKMKGDTENVPIIPMPQMKIEKKAPVVPEVPADNSAAETASNQATADKTPVDFDKELKDLDTASGAVDSNDFGDTGLSNANLGL